MLIFLLLILAFQTNAFAEASLSKPQVSVWRSAEISGAAGIGSLSHNFVDQFFTNPGLLAEDDRDYVIQWFGLNVDYTEDLRDTFEEVQSLKDTKSTSRARSVINALDALQDVFGRNLGGGVGITALAFKLGRISLVPYTNITTHAEAHIPAWPEAVALADVYAGVGVGYSQVLGDDFDFGVTLRPGYRFYLAGNADAKTIGSDIMEDKSSNFIEYAEGAYVPVDASLNYYPTYGVRLSLLTNDIVQTVPVYSSSVVPPDYLMRMGVGASYDFVDEGTHRLTVATEFQDMLNIEDWNDALLRWQWAAQYGFRFHEDFQETLGATLGLLSGYPSLSIYANVWLLKLQVASYVQEGAVYPGQTPERRTAFGVYTETSF